MRVVFAVIGIVVGLARGAAAAEETDEATDDAGIEKGSFGIGLILGEPTGVSARLYLDDDQAVQAAVGLAFVKAGIHAHADYCFHPWILTERDLFTVPLYLGPGVRVIQYDAGRSADDYFALGVRAVGGVVFDFKTVPLDAFVEIAGVVEYAFDDDEGWGLTLNAGAGARYYF